MDDGGLPVFSYELEDGICNHSYALHTAAMAGVPQELLVRAAQLLGHAEEQGEQHADVEGRVKEEVASALTESELLSEMQQDRQGASIPSSITFEFRSHAVPDPIRASIQSEPPIKPFFRMHRFRTASLYVLKTPSRLGAAKTRTDHNSVPVPQFCPVM